MPAESFDVSNQEQREVRSQGQGTTGRLTLVAGAIVVLVLAGAGISMIFGGLRCKIDDCRKVFVPPGAEDCSKATCQECEEELKPSLDSTYCHIPCELEKCVNVTVPKGSLQCDTSLATCKDCETGYHVEHGVPGYCGLDCPDTPEFCKERVVHRGQTDCNAPGAVTCKVCEAGRISTKDEKGSYCALECDVENCAKHMTPRGATDCSAAICLECNAGSQKAVGTDYKFNGKCQVTCNNDQLKSGCDPRSCNKQGCTACTLGRKTNGQRCYKEDKPVTMTFYMYRATKDEEYHPENIDLATAGGVLWYIHNEVVRVACEKVKGKWARHYGITRIQRYKITMHNTQAVFHVSHDKQFGHFVQFDSGQCTVKNCPHYWQQYGYHVGCQPGALGTDGIPHYTSRFSQSAWYSLPGRCPSKKFNDPDKLNACAAQEPGGECDSPNGANDCTWHLEEAGSVRLDEFTGVGDYQQFCNEGKREFDVDMDKGIGQSFWNDKMNATRNEERTQILMQWFAKKDPGSAMIPDPPCVGF